MLNHSMKSITSAKIRLFEKSCTWIPVVPWSYFQSRSKNYKLFTTVTNTETTLKTVDVFKNLFPWKSNKDICRYIIDSCIVYRNGPIIAINKPYGLKIKGLPEKKQKGGKKKIVQTLNTVLSSDYNGALDELLPYLSKELGYNSLQVIKSPERFASGVTLLCSDDSIAAKLKHCYLRVKSSKQLCEEYLAVTVGTPREIKTTKIVGLTLQSSKFSDIKQAVISDNASTKSMKEGKSKLVKVELECLETNKNGTASIIRISSSSKIWHFLRVYLASLLSPVLGDNVHGGRVNFKGLQPKTVSPFSHTAQLPQEIPHELLFELGLTPGQKAFIPVHLHLKKLIVPGFNNEDLVIQAPVPSSFEWTCEKLNLKLPLD